MIKQAILYNTLEQPVDGVTINNFGNGEFWFTIPLEFSILSRFIMCLGTKSLIAYLDFFMICTIITTRYCLHNIFVHRNLHIF